jgi:hypothetical protein
MLKTVLSLTLGAGLLLACGCRSTDSAPGKPAKPTGTPPPSASNIPPPLPPGKTPGPGGMR